MTDFTLKDLESIIVSKANDDPKTSWTAKLVSAGPGIIAKKLGEEATETIISALAGNEAAFVAESADLLYHWLVLAHAKGVTLDDVMSELEKRTSQSGLAEKASRKAE